MRILLLITFFINLVFADELQLAYQKEYAYLIAEKNALEKRLSQLETSQSTTLDKVKKDIDALQKKSLSFQNKIDLLNQQIVEASRGAENADSDTLLVDATIIQAKESLKKAGHTLVENEKKELTIQDAIAKANQVLIDDEKVKKSVGEFFLSDGSATTGEIISIGRVAKYGVANGKGGLLAPAGNGDFRVWESTGVSVANDILNGANGENIDIFLFESETKPVEKKEEKTYEDDLEAGGLVGYVILALGALGILLVLLRIIFLTISGSNTKTLQKRVSPKISEGDIEGALQVCESSNNSSSKVMAATIRNLDKDRDHIEDIISEAILHESSAIDRFGSLILVIAAISPLLGLLGTVTGMISTFDIITEFGTGDPKMLSSGISEALITTKFGLIVAIPMLLLGNMLSSWAEKIKDGMEQSALHIINKYKK